MPLPKTKPAFFRSDRQPSWRSALIDAWLWLRLRFHRNPGFVTAAVAGSWGIVLAVVLLAGHAGQLPGNGMGGGPASVGEVSEANLGAAADSPIAMAAAVPDDPWSDIGGQGGVGGTTGQPGSAISRRADSRAGGAAAGRVARQAAEEGPRQDNPFDAGDAIAATNKKVVGRTTRAQGSRGVTVRIEADDEENEDEVAPRRGTIRNARQSDAASSVLRDNRSAKAIDLPVDLDVVAGEEVPAEEIEPAPTDEPHRLKLKPARNTSHLLASDVDEEMPPKRSTQKTTIVTPQPGTEQVAEERRSSDDRFLQPRSKSSWNNSTSEVRSPHREPAPEAVRDSSTDDGDVETAVFATPQSAPRKDAGQSPAGETLRPADLTLEIKAPKDVATGQSFDVEFIVRNESRSTVRDALLSVFLPEGVTHPLGRELEQPIASIGPRGIYRARMTVKANAAGQITPLADVSLRGRLAVKTSATLRIGSQRGGRTATTSR